MSRGYTESPSAIRVAVGRGALGARVVRCSPRVPFDDAESHQSCHRWRSVLTSSSSACRASHAKSLQCCSCASDAW
eukprot:536285-Pyramimonas_sp.AAC.1